MNIIFGNYGNGTIALIQWGIEQKLPNLYIVSINTHWAAEGWNDSIVAIQSYAKSHNIQVNELSTKAGFADLVRSRNDFPSSKFQWCPLLLKGVPFLEWLDEIDPSCMATILLPKRRTSSRHNAELPEFIEYSEHYGERRVHYPLYQHSDQDEQALIKKAGFKVLPHRSLECDPCIHNQDLDFQRIAVDDIKRLADLELSIRKTMFGQPIEALVALKRQKIAVLKYEKLGCADPYGCGE